MRVVCIANKFEEQLYEELEVGQTYTVIHTVKCKCCCGESGYILKEIKTDKYIFYSGCFAPISDIENLQLTEEEAEAIRERQTVKI